MFRTTFSHNIFRQKYAQGRSDTWADVADRVVQDVTGGREPLLKKSERDDLKDDIVKMRFIPGGRYLYYGGRSFHGWNNCFAGHHKVLTRDGMVRLDSLDEGQEIDIYSPESQQYEKATAHYRGEQDVQEITFANVRGRSSKTWKITATPNHRWVLLKGGSTTNIKIGDVIPAGVVHYEETSRDAFIHGLVFADGNSHGQNLNGEFIHQLRLCGSKNIYVNAFASYKITYPPFVKGDPCVYIKSPIDLKILPASTDPIYIKSFIEGWLAGDGHNGAVRQIHSINKAAIEWFIDNAHIAQYIISGDIKVETKDSNFGPRQPLYRVNFSLAREFSGFKVIKIESKGIQKVYCPFEPKYNRIIIDFGIDTYQCYLLRGEEDTREEWGRLVKASSDCLMTGGGIGIDYSIFRGKGEPLARTGGKASGPIPLMYIINEVGRNVMQGGSRRSAIYASLNWKHPDAHDFLTVKNWDTHQIGKRFKHNGDPYTIWDAKNEDFNFNAPLDMTNISLNYDDNLFKQSSIPKLFIDNCHQALRTGEPGFSFNFGNKQNETCRNACTEVTSEDDSDVCNLGSINLANIASIEELKGVVERAIKFLICGTLRATLPYDKVYEVREKNRRLGLGLMGIHEWLLRRGYKYEVVPELHEWLAQYQSTSDLTADQFCDTLGISRCVAKRAIAPTGTIGIMAATTTGIEPLYAVAYKRRYITDGHHWRYEYVIDSTAEYLINEYNLKPDEIETAATLAENPERRIKFQADIQRYVDMSISSTINLPAWGTEHNNEDLVGKFARTLYHYAPQLRGFTCYPDGARGGQPLMVVDYESAIKHKGVVYEENDLCSITGKGGSCGI